MLEIVYFVRMFSGTQFAGLNLRRYYFGVGDGENPMAAEPTIVRTRFDAPSFNNFVDKIDKFNFLFDINSF